jgi:N4-gp56 family major capsid protein
MAMLSTSTTELGHALQTYFSKKLLPYAEQKVVLDEFANKVSLPSNVGSKTIRFFRYQPGSAANVGSLTEGVVPTTYQELDQDYIEATLAQYYIFFKITDVLSMIEIFDSLKASVKNIGESVGLHANQLIRNEVATGVTAAGNRRYAQNLADWAALAAATSSAGKMTIEDVLGAMTQLTIQRAPTKNGQYYMVVPPQVAHDLMLDTKFVNLGVYQNSERIVKGEVGKWYGIKIVVDTVPFREDGAAGALNTYAAAGNIFTSIAVGESAFGAVTMSSGSPWSPKINILDKAEKTDPANQYVMVATKLFYVAKLLNPAWAVTIRSKTTFA